MQRLRLRILGNLSEQLRLRILAGRPLRGATQHSLNEWTARPVSAWAARLAFVFFKPVVLLLTGRFLFRGLCDLSVAIGSSRRSSAYGVRGAADPRPLGDKQWMSDAIRTLVRHLFLNIFLFF